MATQIVEKAEPAQDAIVIREWRAGMEDKQLWIDFTTILAEYFNAYKNPLTRFDMAHLFNFWGRMNAYPSCCFVAYDGDEVVGCVMLEAMPARETRPYGNEISRLYVKAEYRGKGIAIALMEAAFGKLDKAGIENAFLLVEDKNVNAIRMYENLGFTICPQAQEHGTKGVYYMHCAVKDAKFTKPVVSAKRFMPKASSVFGRLLSFLVS